VAYHIEINWSTAYKNTEGTHLAFTKETGETWPTTLDRVEAFIRPSAAAVANGRATLAQKIDEVVCVITQATGASQAFYLELTSAQTDDLSNDSQGSDYEFWFIANTADHPYMLRSGTCTVRPNPVTT
jgi:hypothetical protein